MSESIQALEKAAADANKVLQAAIKRRNDLYLRIESSSLGATVRPVSTRELEQAHLYLEAASRECRIKTIAWIEALKKQGNGPN